MSKPTWALANALIPNVNDGASDSPDNDLFANVLEYQLGGKPLAFDGDLVTVAESGDETSLLFTFDRLVESLADTTLNFGSVPI
jgi:hypothetical protein